MAVICEYLPFSGCRLPPSPHVTTTFDPPQSLDGPILGSRKLEWVRPVIVFHAEIAVKRKAKTCITNRENMALREDGPLSDLSTPQTNRGESAVTNNSLNQTGRDLAKETLRYSE